MEEIIVTKRYNYDEDNGKGWVFGVIKKVVWGAIN